MVRSGTVVASQTIPAMLNCHWLLPAILPVNFQQNILLRTVPHTSSIYKIQQSHATSTMTMVCNNAGCIYSQRFVGLVTWKQPILLYDRQQHIVYISHHQYNRDYYDLTRENFLWTSAHTGWDFYTLSKTLRQITDWLRQICSYHSKRIIE